MLSIECLISSIDVVAFDPIKLTKSIIITHTCFFKELLLDSTKVFFEMNESQFFIQVGSIAKKGICYEASDKLAS